MKNATLIALLGYNTANAYSLGGDPTIALPHQQEALDAYNRCMAVTGQAVVTQPAAAAVNGMNPQTLIKCLREQATFAASDAVIQMITEMFWNGQIVDFNQLKLDDLFDHDKDGQIGVEDFRQLIERNNGTVNPPALSCDSSVNPDTCNMFKAAFGKFSTTHQVSENQVMQAYASLIAEHTMSTKQWDKIINSGEQKSTRNHAIIKDAFTAGSSDYIGIEQAAVRLTHYIESTQSVTNRPPDYVSDFSPAFFMFNCYSGLNMPYDVYMGDAEFEKCVAASQMTRRKDTRDVAKEAFRKAMDLSSHPTLIAENRRGTFAFLFQVAFDNIFAKKCNYDEICIKQGLY